MGKRFLFGFSMFFALVGVLLLDHLAEFTWGVFLLCVGMTLAGLHELARMFRLRGIPLDARLLAITSVLILAYVQLLAEPPRFGAFATLWGESSPSYLFDAPDSWRQFMLVIPLLVAVIFPLVSLTRRDVPNISARMTNNLGVFLYLIFPVAIILWIRRVPDAGPWLLYFLLAASRMGDVGAFLMGKAFGRHKLIPYLSAGKTKEGAIFGLVFSALGGLVIVLWANWAIDDALQPVYIWAVLGLLVGVAAQAGDLVESAFKRAAGIKDSGQLVPAFGGIMDLMDNFMLTGPLLIVVLALWA
jgi:phosphatidate cytidylyltransferase